MRPVSIARVVVPLVAVVSLLATGCSKSKTTAPIPPVPPTPSTPENAIRLFEWGWDHRAVADYAPLLTEDFAFVFADYDSSGDHFPDRSLTRAQEIAAAQALFTTGQGVFAPARAIRLDLGDQLLAVPDSRPGRNPTWHRMVLSRFDLDVETDAGMTTILGSVRFFLVRGDSALLPSGPLERVEAGDSTSWLLERWEEVSPLGAVPSLLAKEAPTSPQPSRQITWGYIKWLYLGSPEALSILQTVRSESAVLTDALNHLITAARARTSLPPCLRRRR